ncbi:unnamed protein product [Hermetia illucens]|uniref:Uncharacterized protein n=1 Tax=Hermetia illucens TaxID=343691 RepID=A0A7R8ULA6_HERIL|nr:GATA zinc finger domain-containing protein 14-like [Hermetia illucens]CAD7082132.1 unnamed protein product [Hermetia illucens]
MAQAEQAPAIQLNPLKYLNNLPEFDGKPADLQTFITLVERVNPMLEAFNEGSQLLFSDIIKSKLKGRAKEIIEINCHATHWRDVKQVLQNNFGDRLSIDELNDNLRGVTFKTNTLEFYNEIKAKLRRLNNKTSVVMGASNETNECTRNNMRTALNIFKNKIPEPMKTVLFCRNPDSLESAMDILFTAGYTHYSSNDQNNPGNRQKTTHRQKHENNNNNGNNDNRQFNNNNRSNNNNGNNDNRQFNNNNRSNNNNDNNGNRQFNNNNRSYKNSNYNNGNRHFNNGHRNQDNRSSNNPNSRHNDNSGAYQNGFPNNPNFNSYNHPPSSNNTRYFNRQPTPEPMDINTNETLENFQSQASEEIYHI